MDEPRAEGKVGSGPKALEKSDSPVSNQPEASSSSSAQSHDEAEADVGVRRMEAVSRSWSKWGIIVAYVSLLLMANITSLEVQVTSTLTPFATSAFLAHSLVSTVTVVQGVVNSVIKPPISKIANVFGRFESFTLAVTIYIVGYIQQAASHNVRTYASAQIFYAAGSQGVQILQQIFVADTTDLLNRALFSTLFDLPFLWTVWAGAPIAQRFLAGPGWRWGYATWAIVLPVAFAPLAVTLWWNQRRAAQRGILPKSALAGLSFWQGAKKLWFEMDVFGLLLLSAAISLVLIPLTLAASAKGGWNNASIIAMLVVGGVCLVVFPFWERSRLLAPHAFFPARMFKERTVMAGIGIGFFYFMAFYLSVFPYFFSYLLIVQGESVTAAGHITQTFSFTSTVSSIVVSLLIKYTRVYKPFLILGSCIYMMGLGLMLRYRDQGSSTGTLVGCQIAVGIGGGMLNVPAQLGVQAAVAHTDVAAATAIFLTFVEIGGAVGGAISGAIWGATVPKRLAMYLPERSKHLAPLIYGNVTMAAHGWAPGTEEGIAIRRAYQEGMSALLKVAVGVAAPIVVLSFFMKGGRLDKVSSASACGLGVTLMGYRWTRRFGGMLSALRGGMVRVKAKADSRRVHMGRFGNGLARGLGGSR
ncbi:hypothetical protein EJ06DRAFT_476754 [Trichodelitschia bisporula]|uniref:MFS general substrate transporter n=1 Tax=Trichodelitschia bisporula TaxID=703511 RepID=A0A6G1HXP7_9PEZI|nr:hypothetical protein EJ06DRAFT_476754 [Trichodelitschia bisporula]